MSLVESAAGIFAFSASDTEDVRRRTSPLTWTLRRRTSAQKEVENVNYVSIVELFHRYVTVKVS
jgi:hypothetical protein